MSKTTLFMVEDDSSEIGTARVMSSAFNFDLKLAETFEEAISLFPEIEQITGDVVFCLDGQFPSEEPIDGNPGPVLLHKIGLKLPSQTFFIPNSSYLDITDGMINIWKDTLKRSEDLLLHSGGKPGGLMEGMKIFKALDRT